ncbi:helix-turn-helix domain-containing protein [Methylobacterium sp. ID0610]|uniref:helix-turn-helix domain-containing protein n=1 Tax=Methylobacterium carpenticola TaxID=3344827 RepID=UPI0036B6EE66
MITAAQCRAARGLLNWTQAELAAAASVGVVTVRQLEGQGAEPRPATLTVIRQAFEKAGVELIPEDGTSTGGGAGVRMRDGGKSSDD